MAAAREVEGEKRSGLRRLVGEVFPGLELGDDPEIDRYLDLRRDGRVIDALGVYNGQLRRRYPEDAARAQLIAWRRSHNPRWLGLHARLLDELGLRLARRLEENTKTIVKTAEAAGSRDAWGSLGAVDALLGKFGASESPDAAITGVERHLKLMRLLAEENRNGFGGLVIGLERTLRLLREYATLANFEAQGAQDFVARSRAFEEKRRAAARPRRGVGRAEESTDFIARSRARSEALKRSHGGDHPFFDLARIRFSAAEISAIELENLPGRHEDIVIAWCAKYWRSALDPRFERSVFLYSRKYGTRHFEIYRELRQGRLRKRSDDEILTAMSGLLSTGYSYSVTGDIYMQRRWAAVKASLFEVEAAAPSPSPVAGKEEGPRVATPAPMMANSVAPEARAETSPETKPEARSGARPRATPTIRKIPARSEKDEARETPPKILVPRVVRPPAGAAPKADARTVAPGSKARTPKRSGAVKPRPALTRAPARTSAVLRTKNTAEAMASIDKSAQGSISDRIRRLSGRRYDVYRNIFLDRVRDSIHRFLVSSKTKSTGLFDTSANDAEDVVYGFIAGHYEDPFMSWETSRERSIVESLGFSLPSLDRIIEDCYRRL